jgi:nucleoside-diphosphate-sugar epimerase
MKAPTPALILITGASGFIGIATLHNALQAGFSVRATVRSEAKLKAILATPTVQSLNPGPRLNFILIPNLTAPHAYDDAVQGVTYIIHIASGVMKSNVRFRPEEREEELVKPAVRGTMRIMESAMIEQKVKRIVITSSILAIIPFFDFFSLETETVYDAKSRYIEQPIGPFSTDIETYCAGKCRALLAAETFVAKNKPKWDVVHIMPGWVVGQNELCTKAEDLMVGSNAPALVPVVGCEDKWGVAVPGTSVHVEDVAELHVRALNPSIPGNECNIAVSGGKKGTVWEDSFEIVKRHFPKAVAKGVLPCTGPSSTKRVRMDASLTEKVFGMKFASYEEQVKSVVGQYLQLVGFKG